MSQATSNTRKRKANQKFPSKSPEQAEIDYLKVELNAVRTQVIELESSKIDLERKVKIMTEVIKMHEERETSNAYKNTFPESALPSHSSQPSHHPPRPQCHLYPCSHLWNHHPPTHPHSPCSSVPLNCCHSQQGGWQEERHANSRDSNDLYKELKDKVTKLEDEIVDIVNKIDLKITPPDSMDVEPRKPVYRNPNEIPNYDNIEVIAEVEVRATPNDDSIVSIDELVPDIDLNHDANIHPPPSLN